MTPTQVFSCEICEVFKKAILKNSERLLLYLIFTLKFAKNLASVSSVKFTICKICWEIKKFTELSLWGLCLQPPLCKCCNRSHSLLKRRSVLAQVLWLFECMFIISSILFSWLLFNIIYLGNCSSWQNQLKFHCTYI